MIDLWAEMKRIEDIHAGDFSVLNWEIDQRACAVKTLMPPKEERQAMYYTAPTNIVAMNKRNIALE